MFYGNKGFSVFSIQYSLRYVRLTSDFFTKDCFNFGTQSYIAIETNLTSK